MLRTDLSSLISPSVPDDVKTASDSSLDKLPDSPVSMTKVPSKIKSPLSLVPVDVVCKELFPFINNSSLAALASTSLYNGKLTQPELKHRALGKLFTHITNGEPDEVKKMLRTTPSLSLMQWKSNKTIFKNKASQSIHVQDKTAYQLALGEEDPEIATLIKDSIVAEANEEEAKRQYDTQYPTGWEETEKERWAPAFAQLEALNVALSHSAKRGDVIWHEPYSDFKVGVREGSDIDTALTQFKLLLESELSHRVTTGRHFNPNLMRLGVKIYRDHYRTWPKPAKFLFWQRIIGYIEQLFPANYVQATCEGYYNALKKLEAGAPQQRSFEFLQSVGNVHESINFYSSRVGIEYAVFGGSRWRVPELHNNTGLRGFDPYITLKDQVIHNLFPRLKVGDLFFKT